MINGLAGLLRETAAGIDLRIRLTPRAAQDRIDGQAVAADGNVHLAARVRAVPENGKANLALERLVAAWLDVPVSRVNVSGGATARLKTVSIEGEPKALRSAVEAKIAGG